MNKIFQKKLQNFDKEEIKKSINLINDDGEKLLFYAFNNNLYDDLKLDNEKISFLIKNTSAGAVGKNKHDALCHGLKNNSWQNLKLNGENINLLIENIKATKSKSWVAGAIFSALGVLQDKEIAMLTQEQWLDLLKNADLKAIDKNGSTILMEFLSIHYLFSTEENKENNLINKKNVDFLINNSDLTAINNDGFTVFNFAIWQDANKQLLNNNHWKKIIDGLDFNNQKLSKNFVLSIENLEKPILDYLLLKINNTVGESYLNFMIKSIQNFKLAKEREMIEYINAFKVKSLITKNVKKSKYKKRTKI